MLRFVSQEVIRSFASGNPLGSGTWWIFKYLALRSGLIQGGGRERPKITVFYTNVLFVSSERKIKKNGVYY